MGYGRMRTCESVRGGGQRRECTVLAAIFGHLAHTLQRAHVLLTGQGCMSVCGGQNRRWCCWQGHCLEWRNGDDVRRSAQTTQLRPLASRPRLPPGVRLEASPPLSVTPWLPGMEKKVDEGGGGGPGLFYHCRHKATYTHHPVCVTVRLIA